MIVVVVRLLGEVLQQHRTFKSDAGSTWNIQER